MCGIVGIFYKNRERSVKQDTLLSMRDAMVHRGPDEEGIFTSGPVGFAHRRLSIVGLSTGQQPMSDIDENVWIVFNGEIYNYIKLKIDLLNRGYQFKTASDTEVIIYLYKEHGVNCVNYLNGMFSFAIWDESKGSLFLARDRLGIKPLYYTETDDALLFASEIKSLLKYPGIERVCNDDAVYEYFLFRSVAGENTLFKDIYSLLPGHMLLVEQEKNPLIEQYWDHLNKPINDQITISTAVEHLDELLVDAIRLRLMSEVPLGTFCSGGIDSSLVTAIAAKELGFAVNTFSVGFNETDYDESHFAKIVSSIYGTNHHTLRLSNQDFADLLPELIHLNDEPLHFSNSIHIYALSKLAKEFVTVVLTGEGADELFFGYPRYQIPGIARYLRSLKILVNPLSRLVGNHSFGHKFEKLLYFSSLSLSDSFFFNSATNKNESVQRVLHDSTPIQLGYRESVMREGNQLNQMLPKMSLIDQKTYLVSILNRQDKMSMGASVEARVPFLDYRIVEFANSLPSKTRINRFTTKLLVKKVAEHYLPKEVIHRKKSGFGVPLAEWFREERGLGGLAEAIFNEVGSNQFVRKQNLMNLYNDHRSGSEDHSELLWTTLNFLIWNRCHT